MKFEFMSTACAAQELTKKIMLVALNVENKWSFYDEAFNLSADIQITVNTWSYGNFVVVCDNDITAYFEGHWNRPLDIINGFRIINFNCLYSRAFIASFVIYLDYLFTTRSCKAINWTVALRNESAVKQCERFARDYCGRYIGIRHHSQKSYSGKISDSALYEITQEEFFDWKQRGYWKR